MIACFFGNIDNAKLKIWNFVTVGVFFLSCKGYYKFYFILVLIFCYVHCSSVFYMNFRMNGLYYFSKNEIQIILAIHDKIRKKFKKSHS